MDPDVQAPHIRAELDAIVASLLRPFFLVLAALYGAYALIQRYVLPTPPVSALVPTWTAAAIAFLLSAVLLRVRRIPARWAHPVFGLSALLVLANSLRVVHLGGPSFSPVLLLVMLGYATLALSLVWTTLIVASCVLGWSLVALASAPDPGWQAAAFLIVSGAAVAMLTQTLRLNATRGLVKLRFAERHAQEERHQQEEQRLRVRLINTAAHELATPLTPITLQLFALRQAENLTPTQRRALEILDNNFQRLHLVVQNIQEYARPPEQTGIQRQPCDVSLLVQQTLAGFDARLRQQQVVLAPDVPPGLNADADPGRLRFALTQILDNAVKFTPQGGRIAVALRRDGQALLLEVRDTGPGIPDDALKTIFDPMAEDQADTTRSGARLGLHVARRILEAHEGTLTIRSEPGQGTVVAMRIPAPQTT